MGKVKGEFLFIVLFLGGGDGEVGRGNSEAWSSGRGGSLA